MNKSNYENKSFVDETVKIKSDWKSLVYKLIKATINNFVLGIVFIAFLKKWIFIFLFIVLDIFINILEWNSEYLLIKDNEMHYCSGIIFKKNLIIPKKSFKSMDISQSLVEKVLGYKIVKIESPSKDFDIEDIKMSLSDKHIDTLKLFSKLNKEYNYEFYESECFDNEKDLKNIKEKTIDIKNLFLYGITSFNLFVTLVFMSEFLDKVSDIIKYDYFSSVIEGNLSRFSILWLCIGLLIFLFFLKCIATIYYIIKYYKFNLSKEEENIKISYGLFNTKEITFKSSSIKLIKIKANPLRQLLNIYELNLIIKGYTGEDNEKILMYPLGQLSEINSIINEFIPEWNFNKGLDGIRYGKFSICIKPILLIFFISMTFYLIFKKPWILFINLVSIITLINSLLKINNLTIGFDSDKVKVTNGGLFKTIHILNSKDIQAVEFKTNPIQERKDIGKITINYYSEILEEISLVYMDKKHVQKLIEICKK